MNANLHLSMYVASALVAAGLLVFAWRQRAYSVARYFGLVMVCLLVWALGRIMDLISLDLAGKLFWTNIRFLGLTFLPVAWLAMVVEYTGNWARWRMVLFWSLTVPIATNIVIWTNPYHHLFWRASLLDTSGLVPVLNSTNGPWFYFPHVTLSYLAFVLSFVFLFQHYRAGKTIFRRQILVLFLSSLIPLTMDFLFVAGISPVRDFNFSLPAFSLTGIFLAWAIHPTQLFYLNPVARSTAVDVMRDEVFVLDASSRIVDINPAALAMIPPDEREVIGKPLQAVGFRYPELVAQVVDLAKNQNDAQMEVIMDRPLGKRWYDLRLSPVRDRRGRLTGCVLILRDITEKKQAHSRLEALNVELEERVAQRTTALAEANQHLQELDRLKDEFVARIGHELRTPLTNIQLYLHLLGKAGPDKRPAYMQTLSSEANQLQRLIEDLLNIFQLSTEETQIVLTPVHVNTLVAELVESRAQMAVANSIELQTQLDADLPPAQADEPMLREVLRHLVDNALNYAPRSAVTLCTYVDQYLGQPWVCIQVRDTGPGVAQNERAYLFDRFYRGQAAASYAIPGAGLGLSISRVLMQRMGGEIILEEATTPGATFTARLRPAAATSPLAIRPTRIRS